MHVSIINRKFREVCHEAMSELIAQGSTDEREFLPEITLDDFATQLVVTARSVVQEEHETSEQYVDRLVYFAAKDAIEVACQ
jgi:hypothetical protein